MRKSDSVFKVLAEEGLTTLEVFHNKKEDKFTWRGAKEWDENLAWDRYMTDFTSESILTDDYRAIGTKTLTKAFAKMGLEDYMHRIERLLREGRQQGIEFCYNGKRDIRVMYCKGVNPSGVRNKKHTLRAGGIRRHEPDEPEIDVLTDGLNLARAMSYKNALAGLPYGGSKMIVQCAPVDLKDFEVLGFLAYMIDRSRSFTGPDMGFEPAMADVLKRFTNAITGGLKGPLGPTGAVTAYGGYLALKEACNFIYGNDNLKDKRIAIQGLGACGYPFAKYLLKDGAKLIVADMDKAKVDKLQRAWNSSDIKVVEPEDIYTVEADIFSPCAVGGIITEDRIGKFKFRIVMGLANNQLKATSKEGEIELAKKLDEAGIFFITEWAYNIAGVLTGWAEYILGKEASFAMIKPRIELICRDNLRKLFEEAKKTGKIPTELLYDKVEKAVYSGVEFRELLEGVKEM